jgi:hypothetical protein
MAGAVDGGVGDDSGVFEETVEGRLPFRKFWLDVFHEVGHLGRSEDVLKFPYDDGQADDQGGLRSPKALPGPIGPAKVLAREAGDDEDLCARVFSM